jgi:hypothetical protein
LGGRTTRSHVLIIGAGPTGLVLALWLAKLGVNVRIVDKTAEPGTTSLPSLCKRGPCIDGFRRSCRSYEMMPTDEGYFAACSGAPWSGYFGRGLRGKPKFSCFDTSSMFCDENHPTDWPLLTLTAWCLPGSIHLAPGVLNALKIVKSETVIRWQRTGTHWLPGLLAQEIRTPRGPAADTARERRLIRDVSLAIAWAVEILSGRGMTQSPLTRACSA